MEFGDFLGNETVKARLSAALDKGRLSHCYLISGPRGSGKRTLARLLSAAKECTGTGHRPCGGCPQCVKVQHGTHPDVITVDEPEKKTIPVKLVRDACADLYIRPNEGARKIYLFPQAQNLNPQGQNALLKCIEEPPAYGAFLLLTEHPEQLLPTIRSRCVELRLSPLPEGVLLPALRGAHPGAAEEALRAAAARSGGYLGQALELLGQSLLPQSTAFVQALCEGTPGAMLRVLTPMERLKRDQLRPILLQWHELLSAALAAGSGLPPVQPECARLAAARTAGALLRAAEAVREALGLLEANVGPAHICGALSILIKE